MTQRDSGRERPSRLLSLPAELQLSIYELVVIEPEIVLLNCGCDSSYSNDRDKWREDQAAWEDGIKHPPSEPGLTRTCKVLREITLPMFYKHNTFRIHYCYAATFQTAFDWLDRIGDSNRQQLRKVFLFDGNKKHDGNCRSDLTKAKRRLNEAFAGHVKSIMCYDCCCHHVTFGPRPEIDYTGLDHLFET